MNLRFNPNLDDRRATLEHLRAFVAIVDDGGFASASKKLHRTQSAVTQNLQKLEQVLDCKLLERKQGRVVCLTEEGKRFLPQVREILSRLSNAIGALQRPSMNGLIRLGVPDDFNVVNIHQALSSCLEMNPNLRIEVRSLLSENIDRLFKDNDLDVAIFRAIHNPICSRDIEYMVLLKEEIYWTGREKVQFGDLREIPLVMFPNGCPYRSSVIRVLDSINKSYRFAYTSSSYDNVRGAVAAGLGIAVFPKSVIAADCVILGEEHGFPVLPQAQLVLAIRPEEEIYRQFSEYLVKSCGLDDNEGVPDVSLAQLGGA